MPMQLIHDIAQILWVILAFLLCYWFGVIFLMTIGVVVVFVIASYIFKRNF